MKTFIGAVCFFLFVSTALALPILNIREFGAAGDGIADDSAALKQAAEPTEEQWRRHSGISGRNIPYRNRGRRPDPG